MKKTAQLAIFALLISSTSVMAQQRGGTTGGFGGATGGTGGLGGLGGIAPTTLGGTTQQFGGTTGATTGAATGGSAGIGTGQLQIGSGTMAPIDPGFGANTSAFANPAAAALGGRNTFGLGGLGGLGGFGLGGFGLGGFGGFNQNNQNPPAVRATVKLGFTYVGPTAQVKTRQVNNLIRRLPLPPRFKGVEVAVSGKKATVTGQVGNEADIRLLENILSLESGINSVEMLLTKTGEEVVPSPSDQ